MKKSSRNQKQPKERCSQECRRFIVFYRIHWQAGMQNQNLLVLHCHLHRDKSCIILDLNSTKFLLSMQDVLAVNISDCAYDLSTITFDILLVQTAFSFLQLRFQVLYLIHWYSVGTELHKYILVHIIFEPMVQMHHMRMRQRLMNFYLIDQLKQEHIILFISAGFIVFSWG